MAKNEAECARMKAEMAEMERILAGAEKGEESAKKELLERTFQVVSPEDDKKFKNIVKHLHSNFHYWVQGVAGGSRSGSIDVKAQFGGTKSKFVEV